MVAKAAAAEPEEPFDLAATLAAKKISPGVQPGVDDVAAKQAKAAAEKPQFDRAEGPKAKAERPQFAYERQSTDVNPAPLVLSKSLDIAKEFVRRCYYQGDMLALYRWDNEYWEWNGQYYRSLEQDMLEGQIWNFLGSSFRYGMQNVDGEERLGLVKIDPKKSLVGEVVAALKGNIVLRTEHRPPLWLGTMEEAWEWLSFRNGLVNVRTGECRAHTAGLWLHNALGYDWKPKAECPRWMQFLEEVLPGDPDAQSALEEVMGYAMTEDNQFAKGFQFVGTIRAGKGTVTRMLKWLGGPAAYTGLSFHRWTVGTHSLADLIGKRVGVFGDVKLKPGKMYGQNGEPGGLEYKSAELLLNILGQDDVTTQRKWISSWGGVLRLKPFVLANQPINFNDTDGQLGKKFINFSFRESFLGREDRGLEDKLKAELPGIAWRCLQGYWRLLERGQFVQPASGVELGRAVRAASDPFFRMFEECFVLDAGAWTMCSNARMRAEAWCLQHGQAELRNSMKPNQFTMRLRSIPGLEGLPDEAPRVNGLRVYFGFRPRTHGEA
jgi:putative DNA primase/helicase